MDTPEELARDRGVVTLGTTAGLFNKHGPTQRLYALRSYAPDGRELVVARNRSAGEPR